jgi:hypothetical protein
MVNGSFLFAAQWENLAGQTWSTRPFCRVVYILLNIQLIQKSVFFELARLSLNDWRA